MLRTMILFASLTLFGVALPSLGASRHGPAHLHAVHVIVIDKMQYGPMSAHVRAGDIIEWTNHDMFEHSATARDGSFDVDLPPGASKNITMKAGTFTFFCKFHPGMTATLVVK